MRTNSSMISTAAAVAEKNLRKEPQRILLAPAAVRGHPLRSPCAVCPAAPLSIALAGIGSVGRCSKAGEARTDQHYQQSVLETVPASR